MISAECENTHWQIKNGYFCVLCWNSNSDPPSLKSLSFFGLKLLASLREEERREREVYTWHWHLAGENANVCLGSVQLKLSTVARGWWLIEDIAPWGQESSTEIHSPNELPEKHWVRKHLSRQFKNFGCAAFNVFVCALAATATAQAVW